MRQQPQQPKPSFMEQYAFVQWLMQFPALTVLIWLRRDLGYRMVSPLRLVAVTGFLFVVTVLAIPGNAEARPIDLLVFALLTFAIGIYQRIKRWIEMERRVRRHSYFIGTSPFDSAKLPAFCRRHRRVARFADPIFCMLIGLALFPISRCLGAWLIFSGICLRSVEFFLRQRLENLSLDINDGMLVTERQSRIVEEFEAKSEWHSHKADNGIPTGLGEDIESQITISVKQRKAKKTKGTIDI